MKKPKYKMKTDNLIQTMRCPHCKKIFSSAWISFKYRDKKKGK